MATDGAERAEHAGLRMCQGRSGAKHHEERCATPQRESDERSVDLKPSQEVAEEYGSMHGTLAGSSTVVQEAAQRRTSLQGVP
eukprot:6560335-Prymnesium_polylepis.2